MLITAGKNCLLVMGDENAFSDAEGEKWTSDRLVRRTGVISIEVRYRVLDP